MNAAAEAWFAARGCRVTGVDRDAAALEPLRALGEIIVAEQGQCIFELMLVAPDVDQLVKLELGSRAGILAKVGKSPNPAVCR